MQIQYSLMYAYVWQLFDTLFLYEITKNSKGPLHDDDDDDAE